MYLVLDYIFTSKRKDPKFHLLGFDIPVLLKEFRDLSKVPLEKCSRKKSILGERNV